MPATSPEAIERKKQRRRHRRTYGVRPAPITKEMLPQYKITARRMMARLPEMSKADLRAMLTKAVENT